MLDQHQVPPGDDHDGSGPANRRKGDHQLAAAKRYAQAYVEALSQEEILPLLQYLPTLGKTTTVILHGGSVFEFKGVFPEGSIANGFYNLDGNGLGFEGHLNLEQLHRVVFQDRPHRGRASYAFVFQREDGKIVFKVFLGRDVDGEIFEDQLQFFNALRESGQMPVDGGATQ